MTQSPLAGKPAPASMLVNIPQLVTAYYTEKPDPTVPEQRVAFGTSGHRGSAFKRAFNEAHILAISQAICEYRCFWEWTRTHCPCRRSPAPSRYWQQTAST